MKKFSKEWWQSLPPEKSGKETEKSTAGRRDGARTDQQSEGPDPVFLIVVRRYF